MVTPVVGSGDGECGGGSEVVIISSKIGEGGVYTFMHCCGMHSGKDATAMPPPPAAPELAIALTLKTTPHRPAARLQRRVAVVSEPRVRSQLSPSRGEEKYKTQYYSITELPKSDEDSASLWIHSQLTYLIANAASPVNPHHRELHDMQCRRLVTPRSSVDVTFPYKGILKCLHHLERIGVLDDGGSMRYGSKKNATSTRSVRLTSSLAASGLIVGCAGINCESPFGVALLGRAPGCEVWGTPLPWTFGPEIENTPNLKERAHFFP
ncbi:hypothetical protein EDB84DRAFT_1442290 [Lactarius hengduanensis]|nr:hypothetical protein EDB84DRAFT_1442290 [Lactarius hengduanensis]